VGRPPQCVSAEYCVTSCDLGVFVDEAAGPVSLQNPDTCACGGRTLASGGRVLVQRPVRPMGVVNGRRTRRGPAAGAVRR
jgi:hypothetical protein